MYVIEFSFNIPFTIGLKLHYRYFSGRAQKRKDVLKFDNFKEKENLCETFPFL